ncbi:Mucin-5B [Xylographa opegraphella]|nr:Mucin-5B [Xylographa opegraphella]
MRSSISAAIVLLAASPSFASPVAIGPVNGILPGAVSQEKRAEVDHPVIEARATQVCNADNVLRDLRNPTVSVAASSFCSAFLQQTSTVTVTTVVPQTTTVAVTDTTLVTETSTEVSIVATTTALCAAQPTSSATVCDYPAYGYAYYVISSTPGIDPTTCHENCLADSTCQSFQVELGGLGYCNLFNVPTTGNVQYISQDSFYFFDRDCPQYLPPGCTSAPARKEKRTVPIPTYIPATVPPSRVSSACSCFITSPYEPATSTVVVPQTSVDTATTTAVVTATTEVVVVVDTTIVTYTTVAP